jgi:hypothetical protein
VAAGDIKTFYVADAVIDVTSLHSLASSAAYLAGWQSPFIDHASDLVLDDQLTFHLVTHASNRQVGAIRIYLVAMLDDSVWPDVFDGTQSAETWTSAEIRDAAAFLAKEIAVNATASAVFDVIIPSVRAVFAGFLPKKYEIFITGNASTTTTAQLASSGSTCTLRSTYKNVAP